MPKKRKRRWRVRKWPVELGWGLEKAWGIQILLDGYWYSSAGGYPSKAEALKAAAHLHGPEFKEG